MHGIFDPDVAPLEAPETSPRTAQDVLACRHNNGSSLIQEIFRRPNGAIGFQYVAWVKFADAGGDPHHLWHVFPPKANLITDSLETAKTEAEADATRCGADFGSWQSPL
jgi:hypothetical protein